jgi:RNA-binding protein YlmH
MSKKSKSLLLMHFRQDEHAFVERALDWIERVVHRSQMVTTFFLNPRERYILETLVRRESDVQWQTEGGYPSAERQRMIISPSFVSIPDDWFARSVSFIRIEAKGKGELDHPSVLGALLGLGIKREFLGDIHPHPQGCDCIVAFEMIDYICSQLHQVGKNDISVKVIDPNELQVVEAQYKTRLVVVSSMRLDVLIAEGHSLSRSKASMLIRNGKCKVNWQLVDSPSYMTEVGDMISLRGFGRVYVKGIEGSTKKGKSILILDYLI